ncbi:MAG: glycosyltransferase [Actinobacillus minor]|nr:glycosyltransferase [Actinobacillus minor]
MKRVLTVYPNCSLGGMTSVYTSRCMVSPETKFDFIFINDKGGREAFETPKNSDCKIIRKDRLNTYYSNTLSNIKYDEIRITSFPELTQIDLENNKNTKLVYEFHTSTVSIIENELKSIKFENVSEIWVPSEYLKSIVSGLMNSNTPIKVVENIANISVFNPNKSEISQFHFEKGKIPIFWVGRLDKGKNYKDFFRMLALLPVKYHGIVILSLENESSRISEALLEADKYKLSERVRFLLNLTQLELANLYRDSFNNKGIFCSTSLAESFGYGVLEAALCGLPVVTYEVGGISGHKKYGLAIHMVDVGDVLRLTEEIKGLNWDNDHKLNIASAKKYIENFSN